MSARRDVVADLLFQTAVSVPTVTYTPALSYSDKGSLLSEGKNPTLGQKTFGLFCEGQWKEVDKWGRPGYYWAQGGEHLFSRNSAGSLDNWAVMVDTYLAKVTGVTAPVLDKAGHVIVPAKLNLDVYDGPMSYTGANSGIGTNNPLGASAVLGQGKFPSKHVAEQNDPYEWSVGDSYHAGKTGASQRCTAKYAWTASTSDQGRRTPCSSMCSSWPLPSRATTSPGRASSSARKMAARRSGITSWGKSPKAAEIWPQMSSGRSERGLSVVTTA